MKIYYYLYIFVLLQTAVLARTLEVGAGKEFSNIRSAASQAIAGDTILVFSGVYPGGMLISELRGTNENKIYIIGEPNTEVIISGGNNSIQFSDARHLEIRNLIIQNQTSNGMNIDDGGDYSSPTEFLTIKSCIFRNINASGNNDLLKMSGIDNFVIEDCIFENGAAGGSGIDMVGCHNGVIKNCRFINMGSNGIQAKGGTQYIEIYANYFENCGQRTLNLGGSTGLDFFRPSDAKFEAADLQVYSNIFIGSLAPFAFVGSVRVDVINNTIINPERWIVRILQETVDENRFEKCGNNRFENNLIYFGEISTETNIGPNTAPETFSFKNNFWFKYNNLNWQGPNIPVVDANQIIGLDPLFEDISQFNLKLKPESPAKSYIDYSGSPHYDFSGKSYAYPRSAGAFEFEQNTSISESRKSRISIYPNPASEFIEIMIPENNTMFNQSIKIYTSIGECVIKYELQFSDYFSNARIYISQLPLGIYYVRMNDFIEKFIVLR